VQAATAGEPAGAVLGGLAADLHAALATPSGLSPDPVTPADPATWHARACGALDEALALTDDPWLHERAGRLRDGLEELRDPVAGPAIAVNGDLHVGQVLRWRDWYAVIDFDGNPTLTGPSTRQPAARDVAQLLTSLEHVAQVALKRGTDASAWLESERAAFLNAYRERLAALGRAGLFAEWLVRPFAIEQECRELIYAARFLPRWRYAPLGVLRSWYRGEP
jgi:maltokinase